MAHVLGDIRVVDCSEGIAGPFAARLLADYGASVLKLEPPGVGDHARRLGPFPENASAETSITHLYVNANKRSVTLGLGTATGRHLLKRFLRTADVLVESFPPGTLEGWGLSPEALWGENPRLVIASVTPFGQTGPYRHYRASHVVEAAMGGSMHMVGDPNREPLQVGNDYFFFMAGASAAAGTMIALYQAQATGRGARVDVSVCETVASTLTYPTVALSFDEKLGNGVSTAVVRRRGHMFPGIQRCSDGYVAVNLLTQAQWEGFCRLTEHAELLKDPAYATSEQRTACRFELRERFAPWFARHARDEVVAKAARYRVPAAFVNNPEQLFTCPPLAEDGYFTHLEHPLLGNIAFPGAPFSMERTPWALSSPAPSLGQHNGEVYGKELALTPDEISALRQSGVI